MSLAKSIFKRLMQALAYKVCFMLGIAVSIILAFESRIRGRRGCDEVARALKLKNKLHDAMIRKKALEKALEHGYLSSNDSVENQEFIEETLKLRLRILELESQASSMLESLDGVRVGRNPLAEVNYKFSREVDSRIKFLLMKKHCLETNLEKTRCWRWDS